MSPNKQDLPLLIHLIELRKRIFRIVIAWALAFAVCYYFSDRIFYYLRLPLAQILPSDSHFIATHPFEIWMLYLKLALLAGFFLCSPYLFHQLWQFIAPGLYRHEKRWGVAFVFFSSVLFIGGALFGYYYMFPISFQYFISFFKGTDIVFFPRIEDYFGLVVQLLLAFGIVFEIPLVVYFLGASRLVSIKNLWAFERYLIVVAFIVGAVLTPPDVLSQIMLSLPLIVLYQVGLLAAWLQLKFKSKKE